MKPIAAEREAFAGATEVRGADVEFNRNQYFMLGLVVVLLGLQLRWVETFVLNERASRFLVERLTPPTADADGTVRPFLPAVGPTPHRTIRPPAWLGYALLSTGAVLILHSLAMKKPGG